MRVIRISYRYDSPLTIVCQERYLVLFLLVCEQFSWFFLVIVIVVNALNLNILYRNTLC